LVVIGGLIVLGVAGSQFYQAFTARVQEPPDPSRMKNGQAERSVVQIGRFGIAARGVVFGIIGLFLIVAALRHNPGEAKGLGGALQELIEKPYGPALLGVIAIGFIAYGIYSLAQAAFRPINKPSLQQ
jgi:hypothetical protein